MTAAAAFSENPAAAGVLTLFTPHDRSEMHVSTQRDVPGGLHPRQWVITLIQPDFKEREREREAELQDSLMFHFKTKAAVSLLDVITWTHDNVSSYSMLTGHHRGRYSLRLFSPLLLWTLFKWEASEKGNTHSHADNLSWTSELDKREKTHWCLKFMSEWVKITWAWYRMTGYCCCLCGSRLTGVIRRLVICCVTQYCVTGMTGIKHFPYLPVSK